MEVEVGIFMFVREGCASVKMKKMSSLEVLL